MEKEKLLSEISFLQNKLRNVVSAYKSLQKEKDALENELQAINNVSDGENAEGKKIEKEKETNVFSTGDEQQFSSQVSMLMNSLTSLSAEKSRMEANFQSDKKKLRQEKEKCEFVVRDLHDKIKLLNLEHNKEIEQLKTNLIIERHEREKEQNDYKIQLRELQDFLNQERDSKIFLERTLSEISLREDTERYREVERSEKFITLQKAQMNALDKEKHKVQKESQRAYELRIASLESKLSELSSTLAKYNRSRYEDQNEISILQEKISELSTLSSSTKICTLEDASCQTTETFPDKFELDKIKFLNYEDMNNKMYLDKESTSQENFIVSSLSKQELNINEKDSNTNILENELTNLQIKLHMLADQNTLLNDQYSDTVIRYEKQLDELRKQQSLIAARYEKDLQDIHSTYKSQLSELEIQVQKQRERTIALIEEKEQEITTLKSSFQLFMPGNNHAGLSGFSSELTAVSQLDDVLDGSSKVNLQENPHILYYAHELARRDVVITGLRKNCCQLENTLREVKKELIMLKQSHQEQVNNLNSQINRLERCQSREGANLEYLKNVVVNYLHSKNSSSRIHMLNAIAVILKLTDIEIRKIKNAL